jgi:hypothetical protein
LLAIGAVAARLGIYAMSRTPDGKSKKANGDRISELCDWGAAFGCSLFFMFVFRDDIASAIRGNELDAAWATILAASAVILLTCFLRPFLSKYSEWYHDIFHRTMGRTGKR